MKAMIFIYDKSSFHKSVVATIEGETRQDCIDHLDTTEYKDNPQYGSTFQSMTWETWTKHITV